MPGDKVIFLSETDGGKSTFFHTILGNLSIQLDSKDSLQSDKLRYGGKIGYSPKRHWFKKATVRENILFGLPMNPKKLKKIYGLVLLDE